MPGGEHQRFAELAFDDFRRMATDDSLSRYEKIGFPDEYREGAERAIFDDIAAKLPALSGRGRVVLDIGPGCSELPVMIRDACRNGGNRLVLVDSPEMLDHHPDEPGIEKFAGRFPDCPHLFDRYAGQIDAILAYSVLQYVLPDASVFTFVDLAMELLAPGGALLVGDLPNASQRRRFLASAAGRRHHREYSGEDEDPEVTFNTVQIGQIDDSVVLALVARARAAGCHGYLL